MILDKQLMMSDNQALTASAVSTNIIDLAVADRGKGEPITAFVQALDDWTGTTPTVKADLQTSSDGSTWATILSGATKSSPVKGDVIFDAPLPADGVLRYIRMNYTVGGTTPSGHVDAGLRLDR